jgi:hypothetical protein
VSRSWLGAHPAPYSLSYEIYKRLPNDTDLSIFKEAGFAGLNFAYIKGANHYHTQIDIIESIDERSLQHHGAYFVSLARRLGDLDILQLKDADAIYFNLPGSLLVHYSVVWVKYLVALASIVLATVAGFGLSGPDCFHSRAKIPKSQRKCWAFFGFSWAQFGHRLGQTGAKTRQKQAGKVLKAKDEQM